MAGLQDRVDCAMGRFAIALLLLGQPLDVSSRHHADHPVLVDQPVVTLSAGQPDSSHDPVVLDAGTRKKDGPDFVLRASPRLGIATVTPVGWCLPVLLTAEIRGPETEELYCPKVEWVGLDGETFSATESDCPPFEARDSCLEPQTGCGVTGFHLDPVTGQYVEDVKECPCTVIGYPRRWIQRVCLPAIEGQQARWKIEVRLSRDGRVLRRAAAEVLVH